MEHSSSYFNDKVPFQSVSTNTACNSTLSAQNNHVSVTTGICSSPTSYTDTIQHVGQLDKHVLASGDCSGITYCLYFCTGQLTVIYFILKRVGFLSPSKILASCLSTYFQLWFEQIVYLYNLEMALERKYLLITNRGSGTQGQASVSAIKLDLQRNRSAIIFSSLNN